MKEDLKLVKPSLDMKYEFQRMVMEYRSYGEKEYFKMYNNALDDFGGYLIKLEEQDKGIKLKEGFVPCATYWLIDNEKSVLGVIRIRKKLSSEILRDIIGNIGYDISPLKRDKGYGKIILKLGIEKAKKLNITPILVTCDVNNVASKKVIEENGGIFENEVNDRWKKSKIRRYWFYNE